MIPGAEEAMEKVGEYPSPEHRYELAAIIALLDEGPFEVQSAFAAERPTPQVGVDYAFFFADRRGEGEQAAVCIPLEVRYTIGHPGSRLRYARRVEDAAFRFFQRRRDKARG